MTKSIKTVTFAKDQPAEILNDECSIRLVRLNFYHDTYGGTHEYLAQLGEGMVKLIHMSDDAKPKIAHIDPDNMTRLAHAWLKFQLDCELKLEEEKAKFQAEINLVKERAKAIGAIMTDVNPESNYDTFNLVWPATHPLERYNRHWTYGNDNLSLSEVQDRLKQVEKHIAEAQIEACTEKYVSTFEQLDVRAYGVDATLLRGAPGYYSLTFLPEHSFFGFWQKCDELTAGQVEYRLRYVEGVMQQQAEAKQF